MMLRSRRGRPGEPKSAAHRASISAALSGRALSAVMRDRLRVIMLKRARRGETHPCAVLTEIEVREIKRMLADGETCTNIAHKFGVSRTAISAIKSKRNWRHVAARPPRFLTVTFRDIRSTRRRVHQSPGGSLGLTLVADPPVS
jgi:uncharacterized protein (DUF433 family)